MHKIKFLIPPLLGVLAVLALWNFMGNLYRKNYQELTAAMHIAKYKLAGYPQGGVVLMGGSSIQLWFSSAYDLGPLHTVNVGLSGSLIKKWYSLVDTLVAPFAPESVLIFVGSNDLHNEFHSAETVADDLGRLFDQIHAAAPEAQLYYVSVYSVGSRPELIETDLRCNALVEDMAAKTSYLHYIDVASHLVSADGSIRSDLFRRDQLHLNAEGYEIWNREIRRALFVGISPNLLEGGPYEK